MQPQQWKTHWSTCANGAKIQQWSRCVYADVKRGEKSIKASLRVCYATAFSVSISATLSLSNPNDLSQNETASLQRLAQYIVIRSSSHSVKGFMGTCRGRARSGFFLGWSQCSLTLVRRDPGPCGTPPSVGVGVQHADAQLWVTATLVCLDPVEM